jgi:hypothetical protein
VLPADASNQRLSGGACSKKEKHSIGIALRQQSRNEPERYRALRTNTWTKLKSVVDKVKEAA